MSVFRRRVRGKKQERWTSKFSFRGQDYRQGGFPDRDTAQHWEDTTRVGLRRNEVGYIKPRTAAQVKPLVEQYADHLRTLKRDEKYCYNTEKRLRKLAAAVPWMTLGDISAASFEAWRASAPKWKCKPIGGKTLNQYLDHAAQFCDWLVRPMLLMPSNPLKDIQRVDAPTNEGYRRAASVAEIEALLAKSPPDRALFYLFAIYVPLRRAALEQIEWRDLALEGDNPTFTLRRELSKNKYPARLAIRQDLVVLLKAYRGDAEDGDRVFPRTPRIRVMRTDLEAAGVPFDDGNGSRRLDLHALRKTAIRFLKSRGVSMDVAHVFTQHRDPRTTQLLYDDDRVAPEISHAAEKMPAFQIPPQPGAQSGAHSQSGIDGEEK